MKRSLFVVISLVGALLLLPGCSSYINGTQQKTTRSFKSNFTADAKTSETELVVEPLMVLHTLSIRSLRLSTGNLTLSLLAPDGTIVWERTFTAPTNFHRDLTLDSIKGLWILKVEQTDATGNYDITWKAANVP